MVNCAFLRSEAQILRNLWKFLRKRTVAGLHFLETRNKTISSAFLSIITDVPLHFNSLSTNMTVPTEFLWSVPQNYYFYYISGTSQLIGSKNVQIAQIGPSSNS